MIGSVVADHVDACFSCSCLNIQNALEHVVGIYINVFLCPKLVFERHVKRTLLRFAPNQLRRLFGHVSKRGPTRGKVLARFRRRDELR